MISVKTYSSVLGIYATSTDEILAIKVANAVAAVFIDEVNNIASYNLARLLDEANAAELSYNKQIEQWKFRIFVTFAGIIFICVWIVARVIFSRKVHYLSDIGLDGEIDIIGAIPSFKKSGRDDLYEKTS
jgi:capsular polysaccharide biosynthesis protein